jgi:histidinol-phosphate/aromatic aminotransferase/cobyric acid decarboxylase-like protein
MSKPSEAIQRAINETILSAIGLIVEAHQPHDKEIGLTEFNVNVLVNALAKVILADAAAECASRIESADKDAVRLVAALHTAKLLSVLPQVLIDFFAANAAAAAADAHLIHQTNVAAEQGSVQ